MVVTAKRPITKRSQPTNTSMEASSAPPTSDNSLFGDGPAKTSDDAPTSLKRKITDPNLEVITIDAMHDITLIVGTLEHAKGQKAFQVNKGSFRNVSVIWSRMLSGNWAESKQSEIRFPDDSCEAFLIVLRIAHFQLSQLPTKLSRDELYELAILADKYELQNVVRVGLDFAKWLEPFCVSGVLQTALPDLGHFACITNAFKMQADYQRIFSRLVVEVRVDKVGNYSYTCDGRVISLPSDVLPNLGEEVRTRSKILTELIACCATGLNKAITNRNTPCSYTLCAMSKIGVLIAGLQDSGFYPIPADPNAMNGSIMSYWTSIKNIGVTYKPYAPCSGTGKYNSYLHKSSCSFDRCFGDFGIIKQAKEIIKKHAQYDLDA